MLSPNNSETAKKHENYYLSKFLREIRWQLTEKQIESKLVTAKKKEEFENSIKKTKFEC